MAHKFTQQGAHVRLTTDFDSGALAHVEESEPDVFDIWPYAKDEYVFRRQDEGVQCHLELAPLSPDADPTAGANLAFHFRLDGCRGRTVVLRFHVLDGRAGIAVFYANPDFPVMSYDGRDWRRTDKKTLSRRGPVGPDGLGEEMVVTVEETFAEDRVWIAFQYPYSNDLLAEFIRTHEASPWLRSEVVGRSVQGRDIRQITITDPTVPLDRKRVVWFVGLQHCAECGAGWGLEGMARFLLSGDPAAATARDRFEFKFIPIVNVDGVAEGRGRIHGSALNPNREWDKPEPIPEVRAIRDMLDRWQRDGNALDILVDMHGFSSPDGKWLGYFPVGEPYEGPQAEAGDRLVKAITERLPTMAWRPDKTPGDLGGAARSRYHALALTFDGWVYRFEWGKPAGFPDYYQHGVTVCSLGDIQAAAELFVRAFVDFAVA